MKRKFRKYGQVERTEEINIKIWNTFSVLQEDDQEPILEEEEFHSITKIAKEGKKLKEGEEGKLENYLN